MLTHSENGPASTDGRPETLDALLTLRPCPSLKRQRGGTSDIPETWGFRVSVAALGPRLPYYPSGHYAPCPSQPPYVKPRVKLSLLGENVQVSRLHQPELTSELLWASVFPWAKWGGHPHLEGMNVLVKPNLTKLSRAAFSLGDAAG